MESFRSTYSMMSEGNQGASVPHFAWFNPGTYMTVTRNGINPFQGSRNNPEAISAIPIRSIPINEVAKTVDTDPSKPSKKPKISVKNSNEGTPIEPKLEKPKKSSSKAPKGKANGTPSARRERRNLNYASYESSGIPAPFCSCTGFPRPCYRWGAGGWQSACCTTNVSEYPLPMSATRPSARLAGRKMSQGAYDKLLRRLTDEGYDLTQPIDLKGHWARHGTNKFVTIK